MNLKQSILSLKKTIDLDFDKALSFVKNDINFKKILFDENLITEIEATKNVIYYLKIINFGNAENAENFSERFKIYKSKIKKFKFPQVNSNFDSNILYVGKSSTNFKSRIKCHYNINSAATYALHFKHWTDNENFKNIKIELFYYQFPDDIHKDILEIIESSLHLELKPILGRSGH